MKMVKLLLLSLVVAGIYAGCAHDEESKPKDLASDHFEVSAQGGDDKLIQAGTVSGAPTVEVVNISGTLKVKGVHQKYMSGLAVQLIDRDATIFARARTNSAGGFQLVGQIPFGFYMIRVVDKKFRGQLPVHYNGLELRDLTVPVQAVIR
ncbi:hypothetical protein B9G69_009655 [Bdellovibrio sp. SKB1291214]|uniref:hypothetical protein n=1 Tax=Bdellovibrio sp. SKB1291214 TaxID=1732569 RepID=UPI000B51E0E2|nr:hypothetical protein [Bdellovibrio sp. SKB1291214]UYL07310.1 hypothetical protein B9G69_009655 [Bdellovibrio sp. SKB1291214]